ncbi:polysaccharide deacetylase family protein, partial [candidate division KSB1 bacterium]
IELIKQNAETNQSESFPILDPIPSTVYNENIMSISGKGSYHFTVLLYHNDVLAGAQNCRDGVFRFSNIKLIPGDNHFSFKVFNLDNQFFEISDHKVTYSSEEIDRFAENISRGNNRRKEISLTFDGGASDNSAILIMDILREKEIQTTVFLTGQFIKNFPEAVKRILHDGHEIGNHTFSHPHLTTFEQNSRHELLSTITYDFFQSELIKADSIFFNLTNSHMEKYWRAPFGEINRPLLLWAAELGYEHISWTKGSIPGLNMDSYDWVSDESSDLYRSGQEIMDRLIQFADIDPYGANGAIILMHLGTNRDKDFLFEILPEIIDEFQRRGYTFVTMSELLRKEN